jgi:hypothetical protein
MNPPSAAPASLAASALRYVEGVKQIARGAKLADHDIAAWDRLAPLVATSDFLLVGRGKQELDWPAAIASMDRWARGCEFSSMLLRLEEANGLVFMQLDEQATAQGQTRRLQTMTVFEFDGDGKIRRLDAYQ